MPHTASSPDGAAQDFDTGFIPPGGRSDLVFLRESGRAGFPYACDVHDAKPRMKGKVVVKGFTAPAPHHHHHSPNIHSFLVLGQDATDIFLHHYDLFNNPNHQHHVTLEAEIAERSPRKIYNRWRSQHGDGVEVVTNSQHTLLHQIISRMSFVGTISSRNEGKVCPGTRSGGG